MKVGSGGLESMAAHDFNVNTRKAEKGESGKRKTESMGTGIDANVIQSKLKPDNLVKAVEKLNKTIELYNQELRFKVHEETKKLTVQIVNQYSGEVIKQIPPEEVLELEARLREMVGLIMDKKA